MSNDNQDISLFIVEKAKELGFLEVGFAQADFLSEESVLLEDWLSKKMHGEMHYMMNHFEKRTDPRLLVEGAKTVISLLYNYYPNEIERQNTDTYYSVSKYAYGKDYHKVIRKKLKLLISLIKEEVNQSFQSRYFVDSAPVMDKVWAKKAGLGWIGKNSNLINKKHGSFFFIANIVTDIDIPIKENISLDYCGTCTNCIDSCPTNAIVSPYVVDGSKCISYHTIEFKGDFKELVKEDFQGWIFGCDICQDVCPWNEKFSIPHLEPNFTINNSIKTMQDKDWETLSEEKFNEVFEGSAVKRTGYNGLLRNIEYVKRER